MKNKVALVLGIASVSFLSAQNVSVIKNTYDVYSTSPQNATARYMGMAGSMGALGGDISAIDNNPASIGVFINSEIVGSLNINSFRNETNFAGKSFESTDRNTSVYQIGGALVGKINSGGWKTVSFGFNYTENKVDEFLRTRDNHNIYEIVGTDNFLFDGHVYERQGYVSKATVAVGGNYDDRIYVGAALGIHDSHITQFDDFRYRSQNNMNETGTFNRQETPYDEYGEGYSIGAGVIAKVNNNIRLGLSIQSPVWWSIDRDYDYYDNDGTNIEQYRGIENRKLNSPTKMTVSAAVVANKSLAVNVDYTLGLSAPKYKAQRDAERYLNDFFNSNFKNYSEIKIGGEYRWENLRVRGGYAYVQNPFDSETLQSFNAEGNIGNKKYGDLYVGNKNTWSFGLGYDFKGFFIDASYQNMTSKYNSPFFEGEYGINSSSGSAIFPNGDLAYGETSIVSEVKSKKDLFAITFGVRF